MLYSLWDGAGMGGRRRGRREYSVCLERNPYLIPSLYVEGMSSVDGYLELVGEEASVVDRCSGVGRCFGKRIYGVELDSIVDLLGKKAVRSFIVVPPESGGEGLLVEKDTYLEPIPVEGLKTTVVVCEGVEVDVEDTLGYVFTRKGEVRRIRTHVSGVVVYIYSSPEGPPDQNIVMIAPKEAVKRVRIRR